MSKVFKPGWESFFIRLIWIFWPATLVVTLDYLAILKGRNHAFDLLLALGMAYYLAEAGWHCFRRLGFSDSQLAIIDIFCRRRLFDWDKIESPKIVSCTRLLFPSRQWLEFKYEGVEVRYVLSELKSGDNEAAIIKLSRKLGRIKEFELYR